MVTNNGGNKKMVAEKWHLERNCDRTGGCNETGMENDYQKTAAHKHVETNCGSITYIRLVATKLLVPESCPKTNTTQHLDSAMHGVPHVLRKSKTILFPKIPGARPERAMALGNAFFSQQLLS